MNIKQNKVIEKKTYLGSGARTLSSLEKKGGADHVFPAAIHCAPAGHAPRSESTLE